MQWNNGKLVTTPFIQYEETDIKLKLQNTPECDVDGNALTTIILHFDET